jgi:acyl-[acyl-carrier-protein]-phospholipid O-acyltransferase/long-chain-fatty-acid--[acyl-carrier-protein] ligase
MNLVQKNWTALFSTNFLSIFNDNFLKHCIIFISVGWFLPSWLSQSQLISMVAAALVLPYLFFSPLAGRLAMKYSKQRVFRLFKLLEVPIMMLACLAFYFSLVWLAVLCVLLMGILSCMYSPSKYGLIRDVDGPKGVSFGSGVFETMAFLGILIGTVAASYLSDHFSLWIMFVLFLGLAVAGYWTCRQIRVVELPEEKEELGTINPLRFLIDSYRFAKRHKYVNSAVLGASVFWLVGGMIQMNMVIHCVRTLGTSNTVAGLVMCCAAVGIALGCTAAGLLAKNTVRPEMIPVGLLGMIISLTAIIFFNPPVWVCAFLVFCLAFTGGLFEVPCLSLIQRSNLGRKLGDMIAYLNFVTFIFVLIGTGLFSVTTLMTNDSSLAVFSVILVVCALTLLYFAIRHPEFFVGKKARK